MKLWKKLKWLVIVSSSLVILLIIIGFSCLSDKMIVTNLVGEKTTDKVSNKIYNKEFKGAEYNYFTLNFGTINSKYDENMEHFNTMWYIRNGNTVCGSFNNIYTFFIPGHGPSD